MSEKSPSRKISQNQDRERRHPSVHGVVVRSREVTRESLRGNSQIERFFLKKYKSSSILDAVQLDEHVADQFIEYVCEHGKFGTLGRQEIAEAIMKCIETYHGAAFEFISNAGKLVDILGESGMRNALYCAVLKYRNCSDYFHENFPSKFAQMSVAQEVHSRLAEMGRNSSRFSN